MQPFLIPLVQRLLVLIKGLNLRIMDVPQVVPMAVERSKVAIYLKDKIGWGYSEAVTEKLGWNCKIATAAQSGSGINGAVFFT